MAKSEEELKSLLMKVKEESEKVGLKLRKILKEMGIPDHLTCLLRNLCEVKKQQLEPDMEQWTD